MKSIKEMADTLNVSKMTVSRYIKKMFNIEQNAELSQQEKWVAKDKVLGVKISTHEADFKAQQTKENSPLAENTKQDLLNSLRNGFYS